nr:retrovirus-related Pol polyprotein from transposon TNT 1-94 [Tanacetum cinerariifolium]
MVFNHSKSCINQAYLRKFPWSLNFNRLVFDEFYSPPASIASLVPVKEAHAHVESTGLPSSTTVDQDAPYPSTLQTTPQSQSQETPLSAEEESHDLEVAHMSNDPYFGILIIETTYKEALTQSCWVEAMQNELHEFKRLDFWELVTHPDKVMVITLKWIYMVKLDELGGILKNKARLVARGYRKEEGIDFKESFAPVARLEVVRIFLAFADHMTMTVYQISLKKYEMESCDPVDSLIAEKSKLDEDTQGKAVDLTHYRGMVGTLMYLTSSRPDLGLLYFKDSTIALTTFTDADHVGCQDTRRSTSGSMQLLGYILVSWSSKRQKSVAISSTEAKFIALSVCCAQVFWMRLQLTDYGLRFNKIGIYHFIKEQVKNGVVELYVVRTEYHLADVLTKALSRERIEVLIDKLGMRSFTLETLKELADKAEE